MNEKQRRFEIVVYNRLVRDLVERHESHKDLKDEWAENHYHETFARDEDDARRKAEIRYPTRKGFVVDVIPITDYDGDPDVPPAKPR